MLNAFPQNYVAPKARSLAPTAAAVCAEARLLDGAARCGRAAENQDGDDAGHCAYRWFVAAVCWRRQPVAELD